jgi:rod shape determining protein RodA
MEAAKPSLTIAPRRSRVAAWLNLGRIDGVMLGAAVGLVAFSVFTLASTTRDEVAGEPLYFIERQALYAVIGIALMLTISRIDYTRLRDIRATLYAVMVGSIAVVLIGGTAVRGSRRWMDLPFFQFQPSELAKVLLCVSLAALVFETVRRPFGLGKTLRLLGLGLVPAALVFLQPDLGTGIVLAAITVTILFVAGIPWQHFAAIGAAAALIAGGAYGMGSAVGVDFLRGYQEDRLTAFLHPSDDPGDASYQVNQALIAVGSGEEAGRVVFLYSVLFWRVLRVMKVSTSFYGTLIAGGVLAMLAFQAIVNLGMNLGVMPVTGVSLPLISYGGSSVLATFLGLGLLQAIHVQARR